MAVKQTGTISADDILSVDNFNGCKNLTVREFKEFVNFPTNFVNNNNYPRFLHLNIRGCPSNFSKFTEFIDLLESKHDIIALTETHVNEKNISDEFTMKDYKRCGLYANQSKGGILVFYLNTGKIVNKKNLSYIYENPMTSVCCTVEAYFITIKSIISGNDLVFGVVYRPPYPRIINDSFVTSFNNNIMAYIDKSKHTIICGDFNINVLDNVYKRLPGSIINFIDTMSDNNFVCSIDKITHKNKINSTTIDHFWSRIPWSYSTNVIESKISDHYIISLAIKNIDKKLSTINNSKKVKKLTVKRFTRKNLIIGLRKKFHSKTEHENKDIKHFSKALKGYRDEIQECDKEILACFDDAKCLSKEEYNNLKKEQERYINSVNNKIDVYAQKFAM